VGDVIATDSVTSCRNRPGLVSVSWQLDFYAASFDKDVDSLWTLSVADITVTESVTPPPPMDSCRLAAGLLRGVVRQGRGARAAALPMGARRWHTRIPGVPHAFLL
jgi:hypothetical protein